MIPLSIKIREKKIDYVKIAQIARCRVLSLARSHEKIDILNKNIMVKNYFKLVHLEENFKFIF